MNNPGQLISYGSLLKAYSFWHWLWWQDVAGANNQNRSVDFDSCNSYDNSQGLNTYKKIETTRYFRHQPLGTTCSSMSIRVCLEVPVPLSSRLETKAIKRPQALLVCALQDSNILLCARRMSFEPVNHLPQARNSWE